MQPDKAWSRQTLDPGLRVLVVEDSPVMRDLIRLVLEVSGVLQVVAVDNAEEAFDHCVAVRPDLVITDWELPSDSGVDLLRRIRRDVASPNPAVPVVVLTGHDENERARIALEGGASAFVSKPVTAAGLREQIAEVLRDPRPFVRTDAFVGPDRRAEPRIVELEA